MTSPAPHSECLAWVLSPLPASSVAPTESFARIRLVAPAEVLRRAREAVASVGGAASPVGPALPPLQDRDQVIVSGTVEVLREFVHRGPEPAAAAVGGALAAVTEPPASMQLGRHRFDFDRKVYLAGILNNTPDSFYDRGRHFGMDAALARAEDIVREGADIIEIGGETAQAGERMPPAEEIERVVPVVEAAVARHPLPVAVDTYKPQVARAAIAAGAVLINDISGLGDPGMAEVIAGSDAGVVIMHLQGKPKDPYVDVPAPAMMDWVGESLRRRVDAAVAAGVPRDRILVDPGLNFGKPPRRDLELVQRLPELRNLGRPIFVATSRKDYIRDLLRLPPDDLLEGTAAAVSFVVAQGANMLRVHDVQAMVRVVRMMEFLVGLQRVDDAAVEESRDGRTR